jgi:phytoene synthase
MVTDLQAAYQECRRITRREARNFYYAFVLLSPERRRAIYVAYALCRFCDDAVDSESSTDEKLRRLGELRRLLAQCYEGRADEPVFVGLAQVARDYAIPQEYFDDVLSGMEADLVKTRYQDFDELRRYCYQVASAVGLICIHIFGFQDERARDHAIDLGLAMQLTNIARDVKEDLEFGRIYIPQDELARFGCTEDDLRAERVNDAFRELMRFQTQRAFTYFQSGFQLLPYLNPRSRACVSVLGGIYRRLLDRIEAADYDVFSQRVSLSTTQKLGVMAQSWATSMWPRRLPNAG